MSKVLADRFAGSAQLSGVIVPNTPQAGFSTFSMISAQARYGRFVVPRAIEVDRIRFVVSTADSVTSNVDVGLYNSTQNKLVSSGLVAGDTVNTGLKTITLANPVTLGTSQVYYAAFVINTVTTSCVVASINYTNASVIDALGGTAPNRLAGAEGAASPLPATINVASVSAAFNVPMLFLVERGAP